MTDLIPVAFNERIYSRIDGYESLVRRVLELVAVEANEYKISLKRIIVDPSGESSITIDCEVTAEWESRTVFWDLVCDRLADMEIASGPLERHFLVERIHVIISQYGSRLYPP